MTTSNGVPPELLRPVLEALKRYVMASLRMEDGEAEDSAEELIGEIDEALRPVPALAAASGPDAGTPEGEPHALDCAISEVGARHGCTCGVEPLDESGAAAPDAELDRWLNLFAAYGNTSESVEPGSLQKYQDMRAAIHAHVAQVKREARAEGERAATGEAGGTATLYGGGKDGTSIGPGPDDELPELDDRERYRVDLVLRRDKEGV